MTDEARMQELKIADMERKVEMYQQLSRLIDSLLHDLEDGVDPRHSPTTTIIIKRLAELSHCFCQHCDNPHEQVAGCYDCNRR